MLDVAVKTDGAAGATGQVDADDFNAGTQESKNAVTRSGQTLSGSNSEQVAEAMGVNGGAASAYIDGGTANTVSLTPQSGSSGLKVPTSYARFNGYRVYFNIANTNTGNITVNIGQTAGSLLGSKKLLQQSGAEIPAAGIVAGQEVSAKYEPSADSGTGAWIVSGFGLNAPGTTIMLFGQPSAPIGWTKKVDWLDNAMLTVNSEANGAALAAGGSANPQAQHQHGPGSFDVDHVHQWYAVSALSGNSYNSAGVVTTIAKLNETSSNQLATASAQRATADMYTTSEAPTFTGLSALNTTPRFQEIIACIKD